MIRVLVGVVGGRSLEVAGSALNSKIHLLDLPVRLLLLPGQVSCSSSWMCLDVR